MNLYPLLKNYVDSLQSDIDKLPDGRKATLNQISDYIRSSGSPKLNFICTHNSRRSHLGQVWAQTAAEFHGIKIESFSGGTEATAFNPNAVEALKRAGFEIQIPGGTNPKYTVSFSPDNDPMICFSKKFDEAPNPAQNFAAIMTCSEADAECPVIFGASERIKLLYEDPKVADGTPDEANKYDERCRQIASEMFYIFSQLKN
ncbi:MAG: protein-tyrosine-phosphatase [Cyclobacteriaceae bacterium]